MNMNQFPNTYYVYRLHIEFSANDSFDHPTIFSGEIMQAFRDAEWRTPNARREIIDTFTDPAQAVDLYIDLNKSCGYHRADDGAHIYEGAELARENLDEGNVTVLCDFFDRKHFPLDLTRSSFYTLTDGRVYASVENLITGSLENHVCKTQSSAKAWVTKKEQKTLVSMMLVCARSDVRFVVHRDYTERDHARKIGLERKFV